MFFEDMGVTYLGPVDGHDIEGLIKVIEEAKRVKGAVLVHVITQKGKGYGPAEKHPARFHGAEPFDIETGIPSHPAPWPIIRMCFPPLCASWASGTNG